MQTRATKFEKRRLKLRYLRLKSPLDYRNGHSYSLCELTPTVHSSSIMPKAQPTLSRAGASVNGRHTTLCATGSTTSCCPRGLRILCMCTSTGGA